MSSHDYASVSDSDDELTMLGQGAFSCVFRPAISCSVGSGSDDAQFFISKVSEDDKYIKNELAIGKMLMEKVPKYYNYFAPIVENCAADIKKLLDVPGREHFYKDCGVFDEARRAEEGAEVEGEAGARTGGLFSFAATSSAPQKKTFVYNKIRYVGKMDLFRYFSTGEETVDRLLDVYSYLKHSLSVLAKNEIVHYDFKGNNVMIHDIHHIPIIIDFGLSIHVGGILAATNPSGSMAAPAAEKLRSAFYVYSPDYEVWPFEVHLICYLLHVRGAASGVEGSGSGSGAAASLDIPISENDIDAVLIGFRESKALRNMFYDGGVGAGAGDGAGAGAIEDYLAEVRAFFVSTVVGQRADSAILEIVRAFWKTWDIYSLSVCFLNILNNGHLSGADSGDLKKELLMQCSANPKLRPIT